MKEGKTPFFKTKQGGLTIAFTVIIAAFFIEVYGLAMNLKSVYVTGFIIILAAIIYSPVEVYIIKRCNWRLFN